MNPRLEGYADGLLERLSRGATQVLAEETSAIVRLLSGSRELRAVLGDTSIPASARGAIIDDLLAGKVSEPTRRLARFAVAAVSVREVRAALGWLEAETSRASEGRREEPAPLGRSAARERIGGFASTLDEELSTSDLEGLEDALFRFARTIESAPALRGALGDRDLPAEVRLGVVDDLLGGKVTEPTLRLVRYVVRAGRPRDLVATLDWLVERTAAARGWRVARVHAARPVDREQQRELSESLSRFVGLPVELQVTVEPQLVGGVVVEIGDLRIDASARGRLDRLREHMAAGRWEPSSLEAPDGSQPRGSQPDGGDQEGAG